MSTVTAAYAALDDSRHRAELYRMWLTAHRAGFTHPRALEMMGTRRAPQVEDARQWLLAGTKRGASVTDVLRRGASRFDPLEHALLPLGEESGRLEQSLRLLAEHFARKQRLMLHVKKRMAYPMITALAACFIAPFPLLYAGHTAAYAATAFGGALLLILGAGGMVAAIARAYGRKPAMARARLARALATAIEAGLPLDRALTLAAEASGNEEIRGYFQGTCHPERSRHPERTTRDPERSEGSFVRDAHAPPGSLTSLGMTGASTLTELLAGCPHVTPELLSTVDTAERTGDFSPLARLADMYEDGFR